MQTTGEDAIKEDAAGEDTGKENAGLALLRHLVVTRLAGPLVQSWHERLW